MEYPAAVALVLRRVERLTLRCWYSRRRRMVISCCLFIAALFAWA